jgi:hypothetical protein
MIVIILLETALSLQVAVAVMRKKAREKGLRRYLHFISALRISPLNGIIFELQSFYASFQ